MLQSGLRAGGCGLGRGGDGGRHGRRCACAGLAGSTPAVGGALTALAALGVLALGGRRETERSARSMGFCGTCVPWSPTPMRGALSPSWLWRRWPSRSWTSSSSLPSTPMWRQKTRVVCRVLHCGQRPCAGDSGPGHRSGHPVPRRAACGGGSSGAALAGWRGARLGGRTAGCAAPQGRGRIAQAHPAPHGARGPLRAGPRGVAGPDSAHLGPAAHPALAGSRLWTDSPGPGTRGRGAMGLAARPGACARGLCHGDPARALPRAVSGNRC